MTDFYFEQAFNELVNVINTNNKQNIIKILQNYIKYIPNSLKPAMARKNSVSKKDFDEIVDLALAGGDGLKKNKSKINEDKLKDPEISKAIDDVIAAIDKERAKIYPKSSFLDIFTNWYVIAIIILLAFVLIRRKNN